jgi:hypothetical protein
LTDLDAGPFDGMLYSDHNRAEGREAHLVVQKHAPDLNDNQARDIVDMSVRYNNEIHGASVAQTGCAMMTECPEGKKPWRIERAKALSLMAHSWRMARSEPESARFGRNGSALTDVSS